MDTERQKMDVDIVCTGFGPATAGFLYTLNKNIMDDKGQIALESRVTPGMPLQVICYERADDISFGLSGIVTRARAIRNTLSETELKEIPMTAPVKHEEMLYMLDPHGKS
ncbi:MAG TPA: 4Fe-4S ferredoxin, partial [Spirochaetota bacterium]|nr:4Fe-4S ferredoxin [Spirochaetota bacterium]